MLLEVRGEIVNIAISHSYGNLGEVEAAFLDHPLGFLDPQSGQVGDHGVAGMFFEDPFQLGDADILAGSQKFQGDLLRILLRKVFLDLHGDLGVVVQLFDGHRTGIKLDAILVAVDQNQEILEKILKDLLGTEGDILPGHKIHTRRCIVGQYIIKVPEGGFCFLQNRGQN